MHKHSAHLTCSQVVLRVKCDKACERAREFQSSLQMLGIVLIMFNGSDHFRSCCIRWSGGEKAIYHLCAFTGNNNNLIGLVDRLVVNQIIHTVKNPTEMFCVANYAAKRKITINNSFWIEVKTNILWKRKFEFPLCSSRSALKFRSRKEIRSAFT